MITEIYKPVAHIFHRRNGSLSFQTGTANTFQGLTPEQEARLARRNKVWRYLGELAVNGSRRARQAFDLINQEEVI
jgi:hypothetical protein